MGGRGSNSGINKAQPTNTVLPNTGIQTPVVSQRNYKLRLDAQDEQDLQEVYDGYNINLIRAIQQYIRQDAQAGGYTMSQNMNHKLEEGLPLNANETLVYNRLMAGMHDFGRDAILYRAAHSDLLEAMGVKNYDRMTDAQLNAALTGIEYTEKKLVSTAWDQKKNPFIGGSQSGGREVYLRIKTPSNAKVVLGNMQQAEVIMARGTKYRVTGARFDTDSFGTRTMAYPRGGGAKPRVIVDVEILTK